jgi:predicted  nucleic acid-binding Zn-ribbon protein
MSAVHDEQEALKNEIADLEKRLREAESRLRELEPAAAPASTPDNAGPLSVVALSIMLK